MLLFCLGLSSREALLSAGSVYALLGDASLLAGELAQVVQLGTTYLTNFVHGDAVDVGALDGEDTLYAYGAGHLAHGEALLVLVAADLDYHATIQLDTLLGTLDDFVSYGYGVTSLELGVLLAGSKRFLSNFN